MTFFPESGDEPRIPVLILCRLSAGDAPRRLGNVLEIGATTLIVEIDDPPPPGTDVSIGLVVPGAGIRVEIEGSVALLGPIGCVVKISRPLHPMLDDYVRRRVADGDGTQTS